MAKKSKPKVRAHKPSVMTPHSGEMLTAPEACRFLDIKPQTLYAYVSRGLLRAESHPGLSHKLYARDDLEALQARTRARAGHGPTAAGAMRWGDPILDSAITCIQGGEIYYRGQALAELLQCETSFENIAELLWSGELPHQAVLWPSPARLNALPLGSSSSITRRLMHQISGLALRDDEGLNELMDHSLQRARALIQIASLELFPRQEPCMPSESLALSISAALGLRDLPEACSALETALVVSADHELNASTFAARVTASTGADLYASLLAALASFSGPLHGLASLEVHALIQTNHSPMSIKAAFEKSLRESRSLPGFGHRLYPGGDPRVPPLLQRVRALALVRGGNAEQSLQSIETWIRLAKDFGFPPANLDFALVALGLVLGLPRQGASSLFLLGRFAGWTAHILEQRQQGILLRPRARYVGRPPTRR